MIDERLKDWATDEEKDLIDRINQAGSARAVGRELGIPQTTLRRRIARIKTMAAAQGYSPEHDLTHVIPSPFVAKGHSTYYNKDGKPTQQWVKTRIDGQAHFDAIRAAIEEMAKEVQPLPPVPCEYRPAEQSDLLMNQFTFTDSHFGMMAWKEEGGANWDLKIAERVLTAASDYLFNTMPKARKCVIAILGDLLHSDGLVPTTPASGHVLDQDSRYSKIVRVVVRFVRRTVAEALARHETVYLELAEGNHDESGVVWMRELFSALYENEPRVIVLNDPRPYHAIQHGSTALFYHHGHKKRLPQLPILFAAMFPSVWGQTQHRYAHTGHLHHLDEKENAGIIVYQHPTLAAADAYASRGGWLSRRQATGLTYHEKFGEIGRTHVTPAMVGHD